MKTASLLLAVCALFAPFAHADSINFTITGNDINASGTITVAPSNTAGIDEITGISGDFYSPNVSGTITSLKVGSYNSSSPSSDSFYIYDDTLYTAGNAPSCSGGAAGGLLDTCGLVFFVGSDEVNIYGNGGGAGGYQLLDDNGAGYLDNDAVSFSVSPTPEPSTLVLGLTGLLAVGLIKRRMRA